MFNVGVEASVNQKTAGMGICLKNMLIYASEGIDFVAKVLTYEDNWCHQPKYAFNPMNTELRHPSPPPSFKKKPVLQTKSEK